MTELRETPAWRTLESHRREIGGIHLRDLFAADPDRGERLVAGGAGIELDYSKNRIDAATSATRRLGMIVFMVAPDSSCCPLARRQRRARRVRRASSRTVRPIRSASALERTYTLERMFPCVNGPSCDGGLSAANATSWRGKRYRVPWMAGATVLRSSDGS